MYKKQYPIKMKIKYEDNLYSYYETSIYSKDPRFAYVFLITLNSGESFFYSELGLSKEYDFRLFYLTSFRLPYINKNDIVFDNKSFIGSVFYQIFPERFYNGTGKKDYINREWNSLDLKGSMKNRRQDVFLGGDLKGVISKLDYLKKIGIDVVYLTPICTSQSNHKYDVENYFEIDKMFGKDEDLFNLTDEIHKRGMKIVLDLVFNHSSSKNEMFLDVIKNGKKSKYYDFYNIHGNKPTEFPLNYDTFGTVPEMPKLNSNNFNENDYFVDVGKYFITKFDIDGYRLDVANEVSHTFWQRFKYELRRIKPNIILIGENWNNASSYLHANEFESVMNYPFMLSCKDYYVNNTIDSKQFADRLNGLLTRYPDGNDRMMLNLLDSHDTERFYNYIKPNKDLYLLAVLTLISYIGWPMIYYGDEIFMEGGIDPDNRRGMNWDSQEFKKKYFDLFSKIVNLRKNNLFKEGDISIHSTNGLFYIERFIGNNKITVVIKNSKNNLKYIVSKDIILSNNYENNTLKGYSFIVY